MTEAGAETAGLRPPPVRGGYRELPVQVALTIVTDDTAIVPAFDVMPA